MRLQVILLIAFLTVLLVLLLAQGGCAGTESHANDVELAALSETAETVETTALDTEVIKDNLRGSRYCEVLLATATPPNVHVDVYNTIGLNDCPEDAWAKLDAGQIKTQFGVTLAVLNGPRYWMIDAVVKGELLDPTVETFGTIEMRHAGSIDLLAADLPKMQAEYTDRRIERDTVVRFDAGKPVFELVDPSGRIFDMQSYSIQKTPQTQDDLETLGSRLELPTGWTFRTRVLASDLLVAAVNNIGTVTQDDFGNTYQLSQQ
jgi:hypothetical protein